ncbi:MAG TPA: class I SAM-dependent methyltransferase, partial [Candidatus Dormibacteraeota bacterium]|nr:class I SAM-dependent methyltransferase [Candidatus Dormibacteraeota bacterium]
EAFLKTPSAGRFEKRGELVGTKRLDSAEARTLQSKPQWRSSFSVEEPEAVFEHERIPFRSYPYEWPPEMLWDAGRLTLQLAREVLEDGYGLKDATPYNVLYRGVQPVFIDVPSFRPRDPHDPVWTAYGQFVRTFLLPLLVNRRWRLPLGDIFRTRRDGMEPQEVYRLCGLIDRFKPHFFSLVSMPKWLSGSARAKGERLYEARKVGNSEKAKFILENLLGRLNRSLEALRPMDAAQSKWVGYMNANSYSHAAFEAKEKFVAEILAECRPRRVLDAGANTGHFSAQAAKTGAEVVAIDSDPACVSRIWARAHSEKLNVLPLVIDLARPTPALGWRYQECASFLSRSTRAFDCVLMLAFIHHLLVNERVPLREIISLAAELTSAYWVVEFVAPEDQMFRELTRGREALHDSLTQQVFETACGEFFDQVKSRAIPNTQRVLYLFRKKGGHG